MGLFISQEQEALFYLIRLDLDLQEHLHTHIWPFKKKIICLKGLDMFKREIFKNSYFSHEKIKNVLKSITWCIKFNSWFNGFIWNTPFFFLLSFSLNIILKPYIYYS